LPGTRQRAGTMSLRTLNYAIEESAVGIVRNGLMSTVSVITIALSFGVLGAFALLMLGLNNATQSLLKDFEIGVFLEKGTSEADVAELGSQLRAMPHVTSVRLMPKDVAWEQMRAALGGQIELSGVEENPLPDKFRVKLDDPRYTARTAKAIRRMSHVDEVVEARQIVEQVISIADVVKLIGVASAVALFLVTALIVSNTIRLTLHARRREIRIMQLVGATNWFIRLPLVLEGMILGAAGGGIACLLVLGGSHYVTQEVTRRVPLFGRFVTEVDPLYLLESMVALGCFVGAAGSLISIRRFLKI